MNISHDVNGASLVNQTEVKCQRNIYHQQDDDNDDLHRMTLSLVGLNLVRVVLEVRGRGNNFVQRATADMHHKRKDT